MKINKMLNKLIDDIHISKADIRDIYDTSMKFQYGDSIPLEIYEGTVNRCMVNGIRHEYSNYEKSLKRLHTANLTEGQYRVYKNAMLDKIAVEYPMLKEECDGQKYLMTLARVKQKNTVE